MNKKSTCRRLVQKGGIGADERNLKEIKEQSKEKILVNKTHSSEFRKEKTKLFPNAPVSSKAKTIRTFSSNGGGNNRTDKGLETAKTSIATNSRNCRPRGLGLISNSRDDSSNSNGLETGSKRFTRRLSSSSSILPSYKRTRTKKNFDRHVLQLPSYEPLKIKDRLKSRRKKNISNSQIAPDYEEDVMKYLLEVEDRHVLTKNYLVTHPTITQRIRAITIDWIIQVQSYLNLSQETLYQSIIVIDQILKKCDITVHRLQLLAIASLFIISKMEEKYPIESSDLLSLTSNSYTCDELFTMERCIFKKMNFSLTLADHQTFLSYFLFLTCNHEDVKVLNCANFLMESVLVEAWPLETRPSLLAAAALFGALRITQSTMAAKLLFTLMPPYFSLKNEKIVATSLRMLEAVANRTHSPFQGVQEKYMSASRYQKLPLHPSLQSSNLIIVIDQVRKTFISLRDSNIHNRDSPISIKYSCQKVTNTRCKVFRATPLSSRAKTLSNQSISQERLSDSDDDQRPTTDNNGCTEFVVTLSSKRRTRKLSKVENKGVCIRNYLKFDVTSLPDKNGFDKDCNEDTDWSTDDMDSDSSSEYVGIVDFSDSDQESSKDTQFEGFLPKRKPLPQGTHREMLI